MRLGIFLPNWIGDVAMATPAIRALRRMVGDGQMTAVMRPYVAEALSGNPWFDAQVLYEKKSTADAAFLCLPFSRSFAKPSSTPSCY